MKIVFIGGRDIRSIGGIENYTYNLSRELRKLGHECIVWCESDHDEVIDLDGVKVLFHSGPKSNLLCKPWCGLKATLKTVFMESNVSVIHYNAWPASLWHWIPRLCGIPSLMEGHGHEWQRSKYSFFAQCMLKFMERFTAHFNHHIIMCSHEQVNFFRKHYGVESVCISGGVCIPNLQRENNSDVMERFGLERGKYFLFMGRLVQDKNPDYLIKAFRKMNVEERISIKLVIAGSNNADLGYVNYLKKLAEGCEDIIFTGALYAEDKDMVMRNAFCFCIPSTIEGLSIVMLEAASYMLPIIASDIPANREFLGEDALFVKVEDVSALHDAMILALNEKEKLREFGNKNFMKIKNEYTWDIQAKRYVEYLYSIGVK